MSVFAGQGDPRRSVELLWRTADPPGRRRGSPGPRPGLSLDLIVDTAIALADSEGLAALSMRAVGERLGRSAMALYTYVPGKAELLDLMYDRALAELPAGYDTGRGWRTALRAWAADTRDFHVRHPWSLQVSPARPVLGPNEHAAMEALVRLLETSGLPAPVLRRVVGTLLHFVRGAAQAIADARAATAATGTDEREWWLARMAAIGEAAPDFAERFPALLRVSTAEEGAEPDAGEAGAAAPPDASFLEAEARRTFDTGLGILLDGIAAAVPRPS
ncbi:TetR/AcrR family transcriptional regulator [Streptomonospora nanhaiensis]|uniref:AcrR family transcriptional regulator n=1 Tax=Streptomonospora nanhaiensis TaxID=1323731 RepID=A0A853BIN0_9ACTN|nr:TetR/AcrR family transcriptional regulator [Streptomonospora nanhaiensis]MBV2366843.1 TetR/AcrR family transcriptional regulator [Streptomonospora nanhaiensis]NYI94461.1 AcrR family transcriptional regulator [Streptomonospora nanhaiensis]